MDNHRLPARFVCLGGAVIDRKMRMFEPVRLGTSNPAQGQSSFGGVARNVAENLARLGCAVGLVSCVGDDVAGHALVSHLRELNVDTAAVKVVQGASTAQYVAILQPDGALHVGASDMAVLEQIYGPLVERALADATRADWLFADCNAPAEVLADIIGAALRSGILLAVDVISEAKARRLPADLSGIGCLFLNLAEALAVLGGKATDPAAMAEKLVRRGARHVVITLGADGAVAHDGREATVIGAVVADVVDVTGAGDAMIAGTLHGLGRGLTLADAVRVGTRIAARTVASPLSVDAGLSPGLADGFIEDVLRASRISMP